MKHFLKSLLLATTLTAPIAMVAQAEQVNIVFQDDAHHDKHEWNRDEDVRYRAYLKEHKQKYRDFKKLNDKQQADYWSWRHEH